MEQNTSRRGERFLKKYKFWKRWQKVVTAMACVVVFCTTYALILPAITLETHVYCGKEEHAEHSVAAGCYSVEKELTCSISDKGNHKHKNSCYEFQDVLICTQEEAEGHIHNESCYEIENHLTCGRDESAGHHHGESCYDADGNLICSQTESDGHSHTSDCYTGEKILKCGQSEQEGHKHGMDCYEPQKVLTCTQSEGKPHKHDEKCYETKEKLICNKAIHKHTLACESNPKSNVETAKDWEKTMKDVKLTGVWADDVLLIADSQLGYEESKSNYVVDPDGKKRGYSRYGAWYGDEYGHWCAMFVSFCLNYAEVDPKLLPYDCNCQNWIDVLSDPKLEYELYRDNEEYLPKPGDLIFFDWDSYDKEKEYLRHSDHVGLVYELLTEKDEDGNEIVTQIKTIEGNSSNKVRYVTYDIDEDRIMGYGEMPENPNYVEEETTAEETSLEESIVPETEVSQEMNPVEEESEAEKKSETIIVDDDTFEIDLPDMEEVPEESMVQEEITETDTTESWNESFESESPESESPESESEMVYPMEEMPEFENQEAESEAEIPVFETEIEESEEEEFETEESEAEESEIEGIANDPERTEMPLTRTFEGSDYIVTVTYTVDAEIPEDVEFLAEEYDKNSRTYKERYAEAAQLYGWSEEVDYSEAFRLFNIGFWQSEGILGWIGLNETEIEPMSEVQVVITYKNPEMIPENGYQVTHFGDDQAQTIEAEASHEDGEATIEFVADSFSDYGIMLLADDGISLAAAGDSESNLLAYFKFDSNLTDSQGNAEAAIHSGGNTSGPNYGQSTRVSGQSLKLAKSGTNNHYKEYLTITKKGGGSLLAGYNEITFDFWMRPNSKSANNVGDTKNGWPIAAINNSKNMTYLGFYNTYNNTTTSKVQAEKVTSGTYNGAPYISNLSLYEKWTHVKVDYTDTEIKITLWNASGAQIGSATTANTTPIETLLGTNNTLYIGYNSLYGEYFNGFIDELKIYASRDTDQYHVCTSDEIAHVSLDGRDGWQWRENTTDDTGKATYRNRTSSTSNNALANGAANVAPVKPIAGNIYPVSAKMVATEKDHLTIAGNPESTNLIKGKNYSEFAFDFWMEPTAKGSSDNTDFGLFEIGSYVSGGSRQTLTAVMPKNNNNPKQIILAAPDNKSIIINLSESVINQWVHVYVTYSGSNATLWVENKDGNVIGKGTLNTGLTVSGLFNQYSAERIAFANVKNTDFFNGYMDEIIFYSHALEMLGEEINIDPNHPRTAVTKNIRATGVGLYNVNTKGGDAAPLAGVEYTVYDSNGKIYGTYTTIDEYVLYLGILPPGTYTIEQTAVPEGYVLVPQTKTFTVSANEDNLTQAGLFYDYYSGDSYDPSKKGEVFDYENRIYDIILSAKSGSYEKVVDPKNFNFVVDQSNSMLFPAVLTDTGARVTLHSVSDGNNSTTNDASGNSSRLDRVMSQNNLDPNKLYYIKALDSTKSTVYAVWKSADGHWYAQDAAYYAQAQAGVHHDSEARDYQYADNPDYTDNNTKVVDGGGCLDGINREAHESGKGNSISGMSDLWTDIQQFGTANNNVSNGAGTDHYKSYVIYTGSEMNRLTYLKYAIKRLIYQLASMDSKNQVTITSFDKYVEGCMTREVDTANPQGVIDLVTFVDGIQTAGGTAQNYGIAHILGNHATNGNKTSCPGGHLNYTVDGKRADDYIVLITDGALNNSNGNLVYAESGNTPEQKQENDLKTGANLFKQNGQNPKLITIGLSMQDVSWGKSLLADASKGGIATNGYAFLDINADDLAITLSNALIGQLIELEKKDDYANIRDYISDSFYLVNTDGTELKVGDHLNLDGTYDSSGKGPGEVGYDTENKSWYVEWKNQTLGDGSGQTATFTYYPQSNRGGTPTILDTSKAYSIGYNNSGADCPITGTYNAGALTSGNRLVYENGNWLIRWSNGSTRTDLVTRGQLVTTSSIWQGKIYVKAKEDFIGGNVIDANKTWVSDDGRQVTEGAQISLLESKNSNTVVNRLELPTPTLNVRLLPIEGFESEETVFLGDRVEDIEKKIKTLLEKTVVNKIKFGFGLQEQLNKSGMGEDDGVYEKYFTIPYAIPELTEREFTEDEWNTLRNGGSVRVDYTYDDASSHGAVGYFEFKLTKEGDESNYEDHPSTVTGEDVEKYILKVTYTAYKQGEEDQDEIKRPEENVNNTSKGPGTEVGGSNAGNTLETGKGTESVDEIHHVHVIDGEIFLTKAIDDSMKSDQDQVYIFEIYTKNSETGDAGTEVIRTVTVTVPAGKTQGTIQIPDLPRNNYIVKEIPSDNYAVTRVEVITDDTTCQYETTSPTLEFDIGTNMNSSGTHPDHNVIIFNYDKENDPLPKAIYENSIWVDGQRYVYSKPFRKTGEDHSGSEGTGSEGGSTYPRPGYHLEDREVEVYAWESGTIISNDTSGTQYTKLNGTTASLDANHTSYGVLTQNPANEDSWTVSWTTWTSKDETSTTYDWPEGTLISTNTSGTQYQRLTNTQSYYDNNHTSYGILKKNSSGNWVIEWHTWTSKTEQVQTGSGTVSYVPETISYNKNKSDSENFGSYLNGEYFYKHSDNNYYEITGMSFAWGVNIQFYQNGNPQQNYINPTSVNDPNFTCVIYKKTVSGGTTTPVTTWSVATSTANAVTSKLPTTTTTNTTWSKDTSTAADADNTMIPKTTKTIQVEVEDEPEEPEEPDEPGTEIVVEPVTSTTLSYGHGVIVNAPVKHETEIPVMKKWHQIDARIYENLDVYVALYQGGTPVKDEAGDTKVLILNKDNGWTGSFTVKLPDEGKTIYEMGYSVRELDKVSTEEKNAATYSKASVVNVTIQDSTGKNTHPIVWYEMASESGNIHIGNAGFQVTIEEDHKDPNDKADLDGFLVTNSATYELPETGGVGTTRYTLGGLALIAFSLLYGFYLRRERERRNM